MIVFLSIIIFSCVAVLIVTCFCYADLNQYKHLTGLNDFYNVFFSEGEKYTYKHLSQTKIYDKIFFIKNNRHKLIFPEKQIYNNIDFLVTISKFIECKINGCKQTFRTKNKFVLIDEIASVLATSVLCSNSPEIFKSYKKISHEFGIKQKENKMFKILLAKHLLYNLYKIEEELFDVTRIIEKNKNINYKPMVKKKIYEDASIYSIKKFNKNSTKLLYFSEKMERNCTKRFFAELFNAELKLKIIINYLKIMFN